MIQKSKAIILRRAGRYRRLLIIRSEKNDDWSLAGGKVEPADNGDFIKCLYRELDEEIGKKPIKSPVFYGAEEYSNGEKETSHTSGYFVEISGEPLLSEEPSEPGGPSRIIDYAWVTKKEIKRYKQSASLKRFRKKLQKDGLF